MEATLQTVLVAVIVYLIWKLVSLWNWYSKIRTACQKIPGPKPQWLLGNLSEIPDSAHYMKLAQKTMDKGSKLYCLWAGPWPIVGTCHPETAKILMRSTEPKARGFGDGYRMLIPWLGEGLLISDGSLWERSRRLLTPAFHFEILRKYFPIYNSVADVFMSHIWEEAESGKSVEIFQYVSKATLDTILRCSMSYEGNVQDTKNIHPYVDAVNSLSHLLWKRMLSPYKYPDFIYQFTSDGRENHSHCKSVHEFTEAIIKKRRKELESGQIVQNRHPDFLDILLTAKDDSGVGFTDLEIRNEVDTFTFEGHDTTASAISWIIYALGKYKDEQERVFKEVESVLRDKDEVSWSAIQDLQLLTCFIKESMRFYSPVPIVARSLRKPLIIDGIEIPTGPRVDINIYCIHHNPEVWPDHMVFKPDRFDRNTQDHHPFAFIPFSAGPRNCIGQTFAMDEIKVIVAKLIKRFRIQLDPDHQTDILPDVVTRATNGIKIIFQKR